jgi:hypothetical protein
MTGGWHHTSTVCARAAMVQRWLVHNASRQHGLSLGLLREHKDDCSIDRNSDASMAAALIRLSRSDATVGMLVGRGATPTVCACGMLIAYSPRYVSSEEWSHRSHGSGHAQFRWMLVSSRRARLFAIAFQSRFAVLVIIDAV